VSREKQKINAEGAEKIAEGAEWELQRCWGGAAGEGFAQEMLSQQERGHAEPVGADVKEQVSQAAG
jgi:hypothetical protein